MTGNRIGRRIYTAIALFASTLVITTATGGSPVDAADPPIEIVGLSMPQNLDQVHDGVQYLDQDSAGNLYFGGGANLAGRVWKATPAGDMEPFAGNGEFSFGGSGGVGDGGPATSAEIPGFDVDIRIAPNDDVYLEGSGRIRRVDSSGTIDTVAGNGTFGTESTSGSATSAVLGSISDFDVDSSGNIYIATSTTLRKVTAATGNISVLATRPADSMNRTCSSLAGPVASIDVAGFSGVAVTSTNDVYVGVACNSATGPRIVRVDTPSNAVSAFAGGGAGTEDAGGPATGVRLTTSGPLEIGPGDSVAYASGGFDRDIRSITAAGVFSTPLNDVAAGLRDFVPRSGGSFLLGSTYFPSYGGIVEANGATRTYLTREGQPADGTDPATRQLSGLRGLTVDSTGVVYFTSSTAPIVRSLNTAGALGTVLGTGTTSFAPTVYGNDGTATDWRPSTLVHAGDGGVLYHLDNLGEVARLDPDGKLRRAYTDPEAAAFDVTSSGSTLFVGTRDFVGIGFEYAVQTVNAAGTVTDSDVVPFDFNDLASTPDNQVMLAPATGMSLLKLNTATGATTPVNVPDGVNGSASIVVDPDGTVFLADFRGLMMIPTSGSPMVVDDTPYDQIAIDDGGNVYVSRYGAIVKFAGLGAAAGGGDAEVGDEDSVTVASGVPITFDVGGNDSTTVGALGPVRIVRAPLHGTATVASPTSITYTSDPGFGGTDTFAYERCSTTNPLICGVGTVTVTITGGSSGASLVTVVPARLFETRALPNVTTDNQQQVQGRRAPETVSEVQVAGRGGVPSNATAAVLNVTAIRPDRGGFATVYPCGADRPGASTLNYGPGDVVANNIVVKLGDGGKVCVYNLRDTDLVVDVTGYAPAGSSFGTVVPARLYDTRPLPNVTTDNQQQVQGRRAADQVTEIQVAGRGGVPADADAVAINTTVIRASRGGFATVFPCGEDRPGASTLNYAAGEVVANGAVVQLGTDGKVCVYTLRDTDLIVDVTGFTPASTDIRSLVPERLFETRALPNETVDGQQQEQGRRTAEQTSEVQITGRYGIPNGASTVILNVTAIRPDRGGFVTVYPCGEDRPGASTLNYRAGEVVANGTIVKIGDGGKVCVYGLRSMNLIVDVTGYIS